jgi:ketosteroid isomerase-like protein
MRKLFLVLAVSVLVAAPATADDKTDVMVPVHQFIDGFNKGDVKSAVAACADQTSIIDEFPPYEWHGAGACSQWAADFDADAKKNGITPGAVTLGKPRHVDVAGDRAYVVAPTSYAFKQKGKPVKETGSSLTVALQKGPAGWRIIAWTWSKH